MEARINSVCDGQETLFISASTAIKKSANVGKLTKRNPSHKPPNNTKAAMPYAAPAERCQSINNERLIRQAANANVTHTAKQVNCRTNRP